MAAAASRPSALTQQKPLYKIEFKMDRRLAGMLMAGLMWTLTLAADTARPNIVIYLADDLGYGSINAYGANEKRVQTPALNRLAESGVVFRQAYATASVCSPTRYGLLTGRYSWRGRLQHGVVNTNDPLLIEAGTKTLPQWLKGLGYATAHIGKWHLGYRDSPFENLLGEISPGPNDVGFNYHFGVPNNMDDVHKIYVENRTIYGLRSDKISPYGKSFYGKQYTGYDAPQRNEPEVMGNLTARAVQWIEQQEEGKPFFLYIGAVAVHHPIMPSERKRGTSEAGAYGDFIHDLDDSVGKVMEALERRGLLDNTLFIFTSDNGGDVPEDPARPERQAQDAGLEINGTLRGDKHTIYEGGLRVPLIVSWPEAVTSGSSETLVTTADVFATIVDITSADRPPRELAPDSYSFAEVLRNTNVTATRPHAVFRDVFGRKAVRFGPWKYIDNYFPNQGKRKGLWELYHLEDDPSEEVDLSDAMPERVEQGQQLLQTILQGSPLPS
ncbi:MAG: sulfatase family protein [Limisphaerales bacterium]